MFADQMEDLEIKLQIELEMNARREADHNPCADPTLYCPWGIMGPLDYKDNIGRKPQ